MPKVFRLGIAVISQQVESPEGEGEFNIRKWKRYTDAEEEAAYLKNTYLDEITRTKGKFGSGLVFPTSFALGSQI